MTRILPFEEKGEDEESKIMDVHGVFEEIMSIIMIRK